MRECHNNRKNLGLRNLHIFKYVRSPHKTIVGRVWISSSTFHKWRRAIDIYKYELHTMRRTLLKIKHEIYATPWTLPQKARYFQLEIDNPFPNESSVHLCQFFIFLFFF